MGLAASRERTALPMTPMWDGMISGPKLSISDGFTRPYMRRCTDSQTRVEILPDDWVLNHQRLAAAA